jgi:hypothetical protein
MILKLKRQKDSDKVLVDIIESPSGQAEGEFELPYNEPGQRRAVARALEALESERPNWKKEPQVFQALVDLELGDEHGFSAKLHERVGCTLYKALFPTGEMHGMLEALKGKKEPALVELRFSKNATDLGAYPWELLYSPDESFLFSGQRAALTRYVTCNQSSPDFLKANELNLLLVTARPEGDPKLPFLIDGEGKAIEAGLAELIQRGCINLETLPSASPDSGSTWKILSEYLTTHQDKDAPHIFHFDGHGGFGRRCPRCRMLNSADDATCRGANCSHRLDGDPQGYLAFEQENKHPHWVSAQELSNLLKGTKVRLAVLTACKSAMVGGESVFGGMGPALIQAGVPAVVAMQFSVTVGAAKDFVQHFYLSLSQREPLTSAMSQARAMLFGEHRAAWYRPVLYLRADKNPEGRLFETDMPDPVPSFIQFAKSVPGAQEDLIRAEISIEDSYKRIKEMQEYKEVHDLLQWIEGSHRALHHQLYDESDNLVPPQQLNWSSTRMNRSELQNNILKLSNYVETTSFFKDNAHEWLENLRQASDNLQAAYDNKDQQLLEDAMDTIDEIIGSHTSETNSLLIGKVDGLPLSDLVGELYNLHQAVQAHLGKCTPYEFKEFTGAIAELGSMSERLTAYREEHNSWQRLDDKLRTEQLLMLPGFNVGRFKRQWKKRLRKKMLALCSPPEAEWAQELNLRIETLDKVLAEDNLSDRKDVVDAFLECRSAATRRFVQVDSDLKNLCGELAKAGDSLKTV